MFGSWRVLSLQSGLSVADPHFYYDPVVNSRSTGELFTRVLTQHSRVQKIHENSSELVYRSKTKQRMTERLEKSPTRSTLDRVNSPKILAKLSTEQGGKLFKHALAGNKVGHASGILVV